MIKIQVEETLLKEVNVSKKAITYVVRTLETRIQMEKRKRFFLQSTPLNIGMVLEKTTVQNEVIITIIQIIPGDMYLNTGMLTRELQEVLEK